MHFKSQEVSSGPSDAANTALIANVLARMVLAAWLQYHWLPGDALGDKGGTTQLAEFSEIDQGHQIETAREREREIDIDRQ